VSYFSAAILFSGVLLEACLVTGLLWKGLWRRYPYFSILVFCIVIRTTLLLFVFPPGEFPDFYWKTDAVEVVLRFLVVWEIYRHLFPKGSALNVLLSRALAVVVATFLMLAVATFWSYQAYARAHSLWASLERSSGFTQAVLTLGLLLVARYYGVSLGTQLRYIAISFGVWASISTAHNAVIDVLHSFLPYWQIVRPLTFVGMFIAWNWAVWREAPEPRLVVQPVEAPQLGSWTENWNRTQASLRRVKPS
jgi:hypothetical protein